MIARDSFSNRVGQRFATLPASNLLAGTARCLWRELEPLHVGGLVVLCLLAGGFLLRAGGLTGEPLEWAEYLLLGAVVPILLLLVLADRSGHPIATKTSRWLRFALVAGLLPGCGWLFWRFNTLPSLMIIAVGLFALIQLLLTRTILKVTGQSPGVVPLLACLIVSVPAWYCAMHYLWYEFFADSLLGIATALVALLLVIANLFPRLAGRADRRHRVPTIGALLGNTAGLVIFALVSGRSDTLYNEIAFIHWGVFVGPVAMVRQGGWLLWDVPSQYGFLSIVTVAAVPLANPWQAMYVANAACLFLSSAILFLVLRSLRPGPLNLCFSIALTLASVFGMPGNIDSLTGPYRYPNLGGFRFIWCYLLLALLLWAIKRSCTGEERRRIAWLGCVVWMLGTLWSVESALYCAITWLPAYGLIGWEQLAAARRRSGPAFIGGATAWLAVPVALLAAAIALIAAVYRIGLGHAPDWAGYYEYALSFRAGFGSLPIEGSGPAWTLSFVFVTLLTGGVYLLRGGTGPHHWPLALAGIGGFWGIASYFVGRSHALNAIGLAPMICLSLALLLHYATTATGPRSWGLLVRTMAVPALAIVLISTVGNTHGMAEYVATARLGYQPQIERQVPLMDQSLRDLLVTARVQPDDPLIVSFYDDDEATPGGLPRAWYAGGEQQRLVSITRAWLPTHPWTLFPPLAQERWQVYLARYVEQTRLSGWLIQPTGRPYTERAWFAEQVQRTHEPTRIYRNDDWQLIWFEFKGAAAEPAPLAPGLAAH